LRGLDADLGLSITQGGGVASLLPEATDQLFFSARLSFQTRNFDLIDPALDALTKFIPILWCVQDCDRCSHSSAKSATKQKRPDAPHESHHLPLSPLEYAAC